MTKKPERKRLNVEVLEERIAPSTPPGLRGSEGPPGHQAGPNHAPPKH